MPFPILEHQLWYTATGRGPPRPDMPSGMSGVRALLAMEMR